MNAHTVSDINKRSDAVVGPSGIQKLFELVTIII